MEEDVIALHIGRPMTSSKNRPVIRLSILFAVGIRLFDTALHSAAAARAAAGTRRLPLYPLSNLRNHDGKKDHQYDSGNQNCLPIHRSIHIPSYFSL